MNKIAALRTRLVVAMVVVATPFAGLLLFTTITGWHADTGGSLSERIAYGVLILAPLSAFGVLVTLYVGWRVSRPLVQLAKAADALSRGDAATIPGSGGSAEVVDLGKAMARMAQTLAIREEELEANADLLQRANRTKDEFLGILSHELKNPIATAYGGARLLLTRRGQLSETDVENLLSSIYSASERATKLIDDLLALARAEITSEIQLEPLSAGVQLQSSIDSFSRSRPSRKVLLTLPKPSPVLLGDQTCFEQIFFNLLSNADKYSPELEPIEISLTMDEHQARISVRDHGPGVVRDELERMFESFYRSRRTSADVEGKGLGLTVCKRLVEAMGGTIAASLPEDGGLEVSFTMHLAPLG